MDFNESLNIPSITTNKSITDLLGSSKKLSFLKYFDGYRAPCLESRNALLWTNPRATKKDPKRSTTKTVKKPDFI